MGRHKQPWTIFRRKGSRYYYYQTYDENGRRTAERSTGETSRARAEEYLRKLDREGRIVPKPRTTFREFARDWWVWPEGEDPVCPYVASLLAQDAGGSVASTATIDERVSRSIRRPTSAIPRSGRSPGRTSSTGSPRCARTGSPPPRSGKSSRDSVR